MRFFFTLFLTLLGIGVSVAQRNVVLIIADDLSTDYCGFYENSLDTVNMPNIRRLLSKGVRFTNAMSNPVCSPTRAGILTGRFSFRTGVGNFIGGNNETPLDTAEITIPKLLNANQPGLVKTAVIGKWHLQQPTPATNLLYPNLMGFNHNEGGFAGSLSSYTNWTKYTNGVATNCTTYATTETVNNAVSWIKAQGNSPFFLWFAANAPHIPYHLPPLNLHSYHNLSGSKTDINLNPKPYFKASLEALDTELGRMFDSLIVLNKFDSTDFIFISDNGNFRKVVQIGDSLKAKSTLYEAGIKIPFIISGPSVINPGRVSNALVNTQDVFATVLEILGNTAWQNQIPLNKPVDSKSILPILKNQATSIRPWAFTEIFKTMPDSNDGKTIRNLTYKLLRFDNGKEEFYNLLNDPNELNDLLKNNLLTDESANYISLCQELTTLLGGCGSYCSKPLIVTKTSTPVFCYGAATGSIILNVSGGTPPYTYLWNNGGTTKDLSALTAGNYSVTITDYCGNTTSASEFIFQVSEININTSITHTTCGIDNGSIVTQIANGISPYQALWSNGSTEESISNLTSGVYTITVTDGFGCTVSASRLINSSSGLSTSLTIVGASCGKNTGSIAVSIISGIPPYSYTWSNGATTSGLMNLASDTYTVTVNSANGCTKTDSVFLFCIPRKPTTIFGLQTVCKNQINVAYSVDPVPGATTYVWSKPGKATIIAGQGTNSILVNFGNQGGNVQVKAGNAYGFSSNLAKLITMLTTCKEGDGFTEELKLYPNPFNEKLELSFAAVEDVCELKITDMLGQLIYSDRILLQDGLNEMELNMEDIKSGIYILSLEYNNKSLTKKITKQ
jgi:arylsulfatase A-like enzyme